VKNNRLKIKIIRNITSLNTSVIYGGSFLLAFIITVASVFYFLFAPTVFVWAGLLVVAALVSTLFCFPLEWFFEKESAEYKGF